MSLRDLRWLCAGICMTHLPIDLFQLSGNLAGPSWDKFYCHAVIAAFMLASAMWRNRGEPC